MHSLMNLRRMAWGVLLALAPAADAAERASCDAPPTLGTKLDPTERRRELVFGYAQLRQSARAVGRVDTLLALKREAEPTRRVLDRVADDAAELARELEDLARKSRWMSLDDDGLPLIEKAAREAQAADRLKSLAPVVGATGPDFERTLLLAYAATVSQLRFLAEALGRAEDDPARCRLMLDTRRTLDGHYVALVELLDRRYFRRPADTPLGAAAAGAQPEKSRADPGPARP